MPKVKANSLTMNYDKQGSGEPLVLIPFLAADSACYAFQVAEYAKHYTCISLDLRGTGETDKPDGVYSTELLADDVAAFMQAVGVDKAHVAGLSLGAVTGMWLAAKYPERVKSLSLHAAWIKSDYYLKTVIEGWQVMAKALGSVAETLITGMFPWCLTSELYSARPEYIQSLADFVRSRPAMPVTAYLHQSNAAATHDVEARLGRIRVPTFITCGRHDLLTPPRVAEQIRRAIPGSELMVLEGCSHASIYEKVEEFNRASLEFLKGQSS